MSKARILLAGLLFIVWGCSSGEDSAAISVTLTPGSANVHVARSMRFWANVRNSANTAVTWNLSGTGCSGAACGMISSDGLYTAPGSVPSPATITVRATSAADTSKSASATITILAAVVVTVSPSDSLVAAGGTKQFTATLQNAVDNSVTWTVSGSSCTGSECGTISNTGLYTAPTVVPAAPTVLITATSVEDTTMSGSATATIVEPISLEWTWISGSDTISQAGTYGTKGVPSPSNIPGARERAVSWLDSQGNLWLFGGYVYDWTYTGYYYNDLWKYAPATQNWTWISGSDTRDQPGVYGTKGVADPSNCPGARELAVSWFDSQGNLWLFGGRGIVSANDWGYLNDLWKFDPVTVEWTWVSGGDSQEQPGVYGTKGLADPSNCPGAREGAVSWFDSQGNLWLFGGVGIVSANDSGYLNDLWKFDPVTVEWTWVSGSNIADQPGVYGSKGLADPSNVPGGRLGAVSWIDAHNQLWLFGGGVFAGSWGPAANLFNDLWKFDPATLEWAWVSGTDSLNQPGVYGTKGVADPSNCPWPKQYAVSWIDPEGHLWLFGGYGLDSEVSLFGSMNDLWRGNR